MAPPANPLAPPAASPSQPDPATQDELEDELSVQGILLESLIGSEEDTPAKRAEIESDIRQIRQRLAKLRAPPAPGLSHNPFTAMSGFNNHRPYPQFGATINPDMLDPDCDPWGHPGSLTDPFGASRKRAFGAHDNDEDSASAGPSKSRRTTPSPLMSGFSKPSHSPSNDIQFIDLTRDEFVKGQRAGYETIGERRRREAEDVAVARRLHDEINRSESSSSTLPSSGPTAFDRMNHQPYAGTQAISGLDRKVKAEFVNDQSLASPFSSRIPSHVKAESPSARHTFGSPFSSRTSSHVKAESPSASHVRDTPAAANGGHSATSGTSVPARSRAKMPGAFDSDSDDDFSMVPKSEFDQASHSSNLRSHQPYGGSHASSPAGPALNGYSATESARSAALSRQSIGMQNGLHNDGTNTYASGSQSLSLANPAFRSAATLGVGSPWDGLPGTRPGVLSNGSANPFQNGGNPYGVYQNGLGVPGSGDSLSNVIGRTGGYDYQNGIDALGNALPDHVRSFVNDFIEDPRKNEEEIKELLANIRPDMEIPEEDREQTPEELKYPLYRHQQVALSWMKRMEADEKKLGGILADDMGLGKTISSLALMVTNKAQRPPAPGKRFVKTTLIVGPLALIRQWEREIQKKIKSRYSLSTYIHHGRKTNYDQLRTYDVVLTTYGTLGAELGKLDKHTRDATAKEGGYVDNAHLSHLCPLIGPSSMFYRVILDEAQCIKNANTKTAKAANHLKAQYRWCLSGTPMMNNVSELFSLIQFLRIKPYCNRERFRRTFGCLSAERSNGNRDESMRALQALLKAIMLRRSKTSQLDGKPIIELPDKIEEAVHVVFSDDEQQYYQDLEKNSRVQFNKYLRQGTVGKHYAHVLVLLLRLRQACCHPYLHITDLEFANNEVPEDAMIALAQTLTPEVIRRIREVDGFECPICMDAVENPSIMLPCGHDVCSACFLRLTEGAAQQNLQAGQESGNMHCPECRGDVSTQKIITYDIFKKVHMPETVEEEAPVDDDETASDTDSDATESESEQADDADRRGNLRGFVVADDDEGSDSDESRRKSTGKKATPDEDDDQISDLEDISQAVERASKMKSGKKAKKSKSQRKGKGKEKEKEEEVKPHMLKQLRKEASRNKEAHDRYMRYLKKIWLPSAKVNQCRDLIAEIQKTDEKTIVFSQWTILLDLLEVPIKYELGLGYRRYDGGMSSLARDNAARDFMENSDVKVILISLKAGNAGLNLTAASRIIIMDPFWNPYIEMQAIDRAHRIGQSKPVRVHRILIKETVEDRIVALQERKRELVDAALSEKASQSIGRLSADDLAYLFGVRGVR
ncbi:Uu.00g118750.m01.CDS01 [Anthostomella pinea]|uniref:Uu.00g118750.m01.CDS01 n=1 Tax=Anthostomella pinea TaxID=933095 RepID=A0AAI8VH67_9PEZI|nr:Uu.00g118750.m01.CDS01 [Anthostomella pinea]